MVERSSEIIGLRIRGGGTGWAPLGCPNKHAYFQYKKAIQRATTFGTKNPILTEHGTQGTLGLSAGGPMHENTLMTHMGWEKYLEDIGVPTDALAPQLAP